MPYNRDVINNDLHVMGTLSAGTMVLSLASVVDATVSSAAAIQATKVIHRHAIPINLFASTTAVSATTKGLYAAQNTGTIRNFEAYVDVVATGADRTVTVDLQKSTGAGAFSTVLSATIGFTNASTARTLVSGTISSSSIVDGDLLQVVVTVAGAAGNQATGLTVHLTVDESPL